MNEMYNTMKKDKEIVCKLCGTGVFSPEVAIGSVETTESNKTKNQVCIVNTAYLKTKFIF